MIILFSLLVWLIIEFVFFVLHRTPLNEEEIIKLLLKSASQSISIQEIMALSSKKFELMDALRTLEKKQLITKNEFGEYSLTR